MRCPTTASASDGRRYIVLAEDNRDLRCLLQEVLEDAGREVVVAATGYELVTLLERAHLEREHPALIISDVRMAGPSGIDALSCVRSWGWTTPAVLMSACVDEPLLSAAFRLSNNVVFRKPFDVDDLLTAVAWLVDDRAYRPTLASAS